VGPPLRTGMSTTVEIDTGHQRSLPRFIRFGNEAVADQVDASAACNG